MKILSAECWVYQMPLREPYTIAYETVTHCRNVFLKISADDGLTGWGCAAPDLVVTGEDPGMVLRTFNNVLEPVMRGGDPFRYGYLLEEAGKYAGDYPSALAMMDMALYDLVARKAGVPLYKLLGGYRKHIPTSITIGILPPEETLKTAKKMAADGFRILKIKGGKDPEEDIKKIILLREVLGKKIKIRFDANQGYSAEEAIRFIEQTRRVGIEVFEQPTSRASEDLLGAVTRKVHVPVMADESLMTLRDVFRLTRRDLIDMINIKLMKVGGISEAMHINSVAKSAGVESMVGCMDESALGIAAGLHFALARPNVIYADLDGHLDLVNDPFDGLVRIKAGVMHPQESPGLGKVRL